MPVRGTNFTFNFFIICSSVNCLGTTSGSLIVSLLEEPPLRFFVCCLEFEAACYSVYEPTTWIPLPISAYHCSVVVCWEVAKKYVYPPLANDLLAKLDYTN